MPDLPTGTVTFLFTDIAGSTRLWEEHPEAMRKALARHDALLRRAIEARSGYLFKSMGDQICAAFAAAPDAVAAALAAQRALLGETWETTGTLRVRMALHTGVTEEREGDYFGPPLNRIARLLELGHGGQILLSLPAQELARDQLPQEVTLQDLGEHRLRDLARPERVFQLLHPALPAEFPRLQSLDALLHNLPLQVTSFIGREPQMAETKRLLRTARLLTLTGAGGTGKTRLSLQIAASLLPEYPNGIWLVELAPLSDPALVPQAIASVLGIREPPGQSLLQTLVAQLRARRVLLLLDNCEHLLRACAALAEALLRGCPGVQILATSREGLNIAGETTYRLPCLSLPDPGHLPSTLESLTRYEAVHLFLDRATAAVPGFVVTHQNAPAVAQICHRLDGIPLALELAAARVKVLSIDQITARLDDRFRLLTGGSRTALPRQQTLRALIDWSYDLLTEGERTLLRRLSVFAGGWTLAAAESTCGGGTMEEREVLDLLTGLVEKSLVLADAPDDRREPAARTLAAGRTPPGLREARYCLLETVRQYGWERLCEAGEGEALRARHLDCYLALAETVAPGLHGAEQCAWLNRLEREYDNLRAALQWGLEEPRGAGPGLRLAGALEWFWAMRGYLSEGREHLDRILSRGDGEAPEAARTTARAAALNAAAALAHRQLDPGPWAARCRESLALCREIHDRRGLIFSLIWAGGVTHFEGDSDRAIALLQESVALAREEGDRWPLAYSLNALGIPTIDRGEYRQAVFLLEESAGLFRDLGDQWGLSRSMGNLGMIADRQGNYARAGALYRESLVLRHAVGDPWGIAEILDALAGVAAAEGEPEKGARWFGAAQSLHDALSAPSPSELKVDAHIAAARAALGEAAFAAAWAQGRTLTLDQAVTEALEEPGRG